MSEACVIGVDIGTGSVKAVAVDAKGDTVGTAQKYYTGKYTPHEQDAEQVFTMVVECILELVQQLQAPPTAVSFSAAMHSLVAVDNAGKALSMASLWSDTRSHLVAESLRRTPFGQSFYRTTGTPIHSMSPLCKLRWMKDNEPALFEKANKFISLKEYVWYKLFGEYRIDWSIASATGLFDVHQLKWHQPALDFAGVNAGQLSEPVSTSYKKSGMALALANKMNLPASTPFIIGASDGCLANLGSLCLDKSTAAVTIGTSAAVRITSSKPFTDDERMLFTYRLDEENFVCGGASNNGGNVLQWLLKNFRSSGGEASEFNQLFHEIETIPAGSEGLLFLPYLHGERAPVWDEQSCGVFFGVKPLHTQAHFSRAVVEGVCLALTEILTALEERAGTVQHLWCSGGATAHPVMAQLLADVSGRTVSLQEDGDASAKGAAYLGLKALGIINRYSQIEVKPAQNYYPADVGKPYENSLAVYRQLYPALKDSMHLLRKSREDLQ